MTGERKETVLQVTDIRDSRLTTNGKHIVVEVDGPSGVFAFSIPVENAPKLVLAAVRFIDQGNLVPGQSGRVPAFPTTSATISQGPKGEHLLGFDLPTGGRLTVRLQPDLARRLWEMLGIQLGLLKVDGSEGPKQ